jgi:hypothetical protein
MQIGLVSYPKKSRMMHLVINDNQGEIQNKVINYDIECIVKNGKTVCHDKDVYAGSNANMVLKKQYI